MNPAASGGSSRPSPSLLACAGLLLYAFALLSIGLQADWRLRHEDNGAMHTTLALSHQRLGLGETRAHDVFVDRYNGDRIVYGHHPPGPPLVLAAAFTLTGRDTPAVARLTVIAFHLVSLLLLMRMVTRILSADAALLAGFVMATVPMSSYFGRMVNYEAICLTGVMLQLLGYVRARQGARGGLPMLAAGVVLGGLADWPSFFFAAALALVELIDRLRGRRSSPAVLTVLVIAAPATFAFDLWHLWFAGGGSVDRLSNVLALNRPMWQQEFTLPRFMLGQIDTFRRYFTDVGLIAACVAGYALLRPRRAFPAVLFGDGDSGVLRRTMAASGLAACGYVVAAPRWAMAHQYWQFYFLPFVAIAMVLCWRLVRQQVGGPTRPLPGRARTWQAFQIVFVLDMLGASAYWLHFRHTRPEAYAIEHTQEIRERFLLPRSLDGTAP